MEQKKPRRTRLAPGLSMLDYGAGYVEAVTDDDDLIGTATRLYVKDGCTVGGWMIRGSGDDFGPIGTKTEALAEFREWAIEVHAAHEGRQ